MASKPAREREGEVHSPAVERNLAPLPAVLLLVVEVVHGPPALRLGEVREEVVVRARGRALLLDDDLRDRLVEREDDVLALLPELQLLERVETLGADADAGGLRRARQMSADRRRAVGDVVRTMFAGCRVRWDGLW